MRTLAPLLLFLVACPPDADTDDGRVQPDTDTDEVVDTDTGGDPLEALRLPQPTEADGAHFATHEVCANCHSTVAGATALKDAAGRAVGPVDLWRGSMMAHAARDPLFRATLAAEIAATPDAADAIVDKCLSCHAPMAVHEADLAGTAAPGRDILTEATLAGDLARDGASCVACHAQDPSRLDDDSTWSGHHPYDPGRRLYGPHIAPFSGPMVNFAGFTPVADDGVFDGALCASCHTLQTDALTPDGVPTGHTLTEQAPYIEWRSSAYDPANGQDQAMTCQGCHMPTVDEEGRPIRTRIARNPAGRDFPRVQPREPFGRHVLLGGNTFGLELIRDHRDLLGSPATDADLQAALDATRANLTTAAEVTVGLAEVTADRRLQLDVTVHNRTGHKLPTGYPARRAWLHLQVRDGTGALVVEVGGTDDEGRLLADGAPLASESTAGAPEPHRSTIRSPSDVVVWQSVMADPEGRPTTTLLRGATWLKDTRILPVGFDPAPADAPLVAPVGVDEDPDFVGGADTVRVDLPVEGSGPFSVSVAVRYQAFTPAFLDALRAVDTPESRGLDAMLQGRGIPVETLATARIDDVPAP